MGRDALAQSWFFDKNWNRVEKTLEERVSDLEDLVNTLILTVDSLEEEKYNR